MVSLAQCISQVNAIQSQASQPLDWSRHDALAKELDEVKDNVETIDAGIFTKDLKDQIICLYGQIDDSLIAYELGTIQNEALLLQESLQKGDGKKLSQTINSLKHHIASLWDHYCPSLQERRVLAFAEEQLEEASQCTKAPSLSLEEREEVESALAAIGDALSQNDDKRAAFAFNGLSEAQKKLLCSYLPKEERSGLLHEIKRAADNDKIFLRKR